MKIKNSARNTTTTVSSLSIVDTHSRSADICKRKKKIVIMTRILSYQGERYRQPATGKLVYRTRNTVSIFV